MEVFLNNNTDRVYRFAEDLDDYTLVHSSQFATDNTTTKLYENFPAFAYNTRPFDEYIVIIEADKPVNFECETAFRAIARTNDFVVSQSILAYMPLGTPTSGTDHLQTCYFGSWELNEKIGFQYDYTILSAVNNVTAPIQDFADYIEGLGNTTSIGFREAKTSTFSVFKMMGEFFVLNVAEFNEMQANCTVKVYKKNLIAGV